MATWQHLRSSTAHKRPTTSLADGRIAINTNTASPGLFFKDSAGTGIVKVGPVHVGTTAPNSTPAVGGSTGNYRGEQWLDTSVSPAQMKVWNGSAWVAIVADELPVSKLQDGAAGQIIQTDSAGTGVEWSNTTNLPLGTATAPAYSFQGDANTGIYSPGADQVAISTNGTRRLLVDSSGLLHLQGSGATLRVDNSDAGANVYGDLINAVGGTTTLRARGGAATHGSISLNTWDGTTDSSRLFISPGGNVGVGDTGPDSTLTIKAATGVTPLRVSGPSSEFARVDSSGRLLVGTSSQSGGALLQVNGDRVRIATAKTPASASDTGTTGEVCWDASYIYVCTATNTWKRAALSTW